MLHVWFASLQSSCKGQNADRTVNRLLNRQQDAIWNDCAADSAYIVVPDYEYPARPGRHQL